MNHSPPSWTLRASMRAFIREPSPVFLLLLWGTCVATWAFRSNGFSWKDGLTVAGILVYWPFQEWWMHRLLLHLPPVTVGGRTVEFEFARKHRLHHEDPTRVDLIFLPLSAVLSALIVLLALSWWIGHGDTSYVALFMATASFSTLVYEWTHYLTHSPYKPRSRYFRTIWKQHRWHHYKNEHYWFSFTMPWLDPWLGTGPDVNLVNASGTARHLGRTPEGE